MPRCATHPDTEVEASCARCGDFLCRLCTPLEPVALCPRCAVRCTVDWEERGELGLGRAFFSTLRESLGGPVRLGEKLGGAGYASAALQYTFVCGLSGFLPLSLLAAVPLLIWADPQRLGLSSTGSLGAAVAGVLGAFVASTLLTLLPILLGAWGWALGRSLGIRLRFDVALRAAAYGASMIALPVLGPLLLPLAVCWMLLILFGALRARLRR